jgi:hypothetical protein
MKLTSDAVFCPSSLLESSRSVFTLSAVVAGAYLDFKDCLASDGISYGVQIACPGNCHTLVAEPCRFTLLRITPDCMVLGGTQKPDLAAQM